MSHIRDNGSCAREWEIDLKKLLIAFALLPVLFSGAQAGPRDDSLGGIARCGEQTDDRAWLDCVYGAVQPVRAKLGLAPAPTFQQKLAAAPEHAAPPPVGAAAPHPSESRWIALRTYRFDRHGMFTATLADGTVWQQDQADVNYAHWTGPASRYLVSVAGGIFGSATLDVRNDGNEYRVRGIR